MTWGNIKIKVVTWNCAGNMPQTTLDIADILLPGRDSGILPDVIVVGLQEMVKLNAQQVIKGKDKERIGLWESIITRSIRS